MQNVRVVIYFVTVNLLVILLGCGGDDNRNGVQAVAEPEPAPAPAPAQLNIKIQTSLQKENNSWLRLSAGLKNQKYEGQLKFYELLDWWRSLKHLQQQFQIAQGTTNEYVKSDIEELLLGVQANLISRQVQLADISSLEPEDETSPFLLRFHSIPLSKLNLATYIIEDIEAISGDLKNSYTSLAQTNINHLTDNFEPPILARLQFSLDVQEQNYTFYAQENCLGLELTSPIATPVSAVNCNDVIAEGHFDQVISSYKVGEACKDVDQKFQNLCYGLVVNEDIQDTNLAQAEALDLISKTEFHSFHSGSKCSETRTIARMVNPSISTCGLVNLNLSLYNQAPVNVQSRYVSQGDAECTDIKASPFKNTCLNASPASNLEFSYLFSTGFETNEAVGQPVESLANEYMTFVNPMPYDASFPIPDGFSLGFNYEKLGSPSERFARITTDPTNSNNHVMQYWINKATIPAGYLDHNKGRIQMGFDLETEFNTLDEIHYKQRVYFHPDIGKMAMGPLNNDGWWISIKFGTLWFDQWQSTTQTRLSFALVPNFQNGHIYFQSQNIQQKNTHNGTGNMWLVTADGSTTSSENRQWASQILNGNYPIPLGEWITLEVGYKMGDRNNGRFVMTAQSDNDVEPVVLFNITGRTYSPDSASPIPLSYFQPWKVYSSDNTIDHIRGTNPNDEKAIQVYWDDFRFTDKLPNHAPFKE